MRDFWRLKEILQHLLPRIRLLDALAQLWKRAVIINLPLQPTLLQDDSVDFIEVVK
jgi:hypothetical protein